jgi:agmatinase
MTKINKPFLGTDLEKNHFEEAEIILQSLPYDGTSSWGKGADRGFEAMIEASEYVETYDIETDSEVYTRGIHLPDPVIDESSPEANTEAVYSRTRELLQSGKFLTFFGGEHSVSIGTIRAFREAWPDLTVLQMDAHTDLRPEYHGSPFNHACALHEASKHVNLVQVGIRSTDTVELPYLNRNQCYFAEEIAGTTGWMEKSIGQMTDNVYITFDLDCFDPSVMPSTGTPEPGGLDWITVIRYLRKVFQEKNVVGFDIVELAPIEGLHAPDFTAAKLYYKMLNYKFEL